jgi:hypothetical protein
MCIGNVFAVVAAGLTSTSSQKIVGFSNYLRHNAGIPQGVMGALSAPEHGFRRITFSPNRHRSIDMADPKWRGLLHLFCATLALLSTTQAQQRSFTNKENNVSVPLPRGWDQVQGIQDSTLLKLVRSGTGGQKARITLILNDIPPGRVADGFDIWEMTNEQLRKAGGKSFLGEKVDVLDVGRASIDGVHVVWHSSYRQIMEQGELWEFVYEGIRGSQYLTIRLTVTGNKGWYESNQAIFADIIMGLRLR